MEADTKSAIGNLIRVYQAGDEVAIITSDGPVTVKLLEFAGRGKVRMAIEAPRVCEIRRSSSD